MWSVVESTSLNNENRLDAEFFQPKYLALERILGQRGSVPLKRFLVDIRYGLNVPPHYVDKGLPFIRALNLKEYGIEGEILKIPYTPKQVGDINILQEGDLLIVRSGANVGDLGVVIDSLVGAAIGSYVIRMTVQGINPFYLYVYMKSRFGREQTIRFRSGAAQPNISIPNLERVSIIAPSVNEQNDIKEMLFSSSRMLKKAQSLFAQAENLLVEALGFDARGFKDPYSGDLTYSASASQVFAAGRLDSTYWNTKYVQIIEMLKNQPHYKLNEIASFSNGATPRGAKYIDKGVPFLRIQNIGINRIDLNDVVYIDEVTHNSVLNRSKLIPKDVLITITGRIGTSSVVPEGLGNANINQHIVRLRIRNQAVNPYYLAAFLNSPAGLLQSQRESYGTTRDALPYYCLERILVPEINQRVQNKIERIILEARNAEQESRHILEESKSLVEHLVLARV